MPNSILGSEFRLTTKAAKHLRELAGEVRSQPGFEEVALLITWSSGNIGDGDDFIPGPSVAADDRCEFLSRVQDRHYVVDDEKFHILLDGKRLQECRDKVLDYRAGRLMLVYGDDLFI